MTRAKSRLAAGRRRALLLAALLPLLAHCAPAASRPEPVPPPAAGAAARGASPALVPDAALQALIDPYPAQSGPSWLGGDVASSIRLAHDRWVWIFGDTLLGTLRGDCAARGGECRREVGGPGAGMIANSAGTMVRGPDGSFYPVVKYWRIADGAPAPILATDEEGFLWPLAGVRVGAVLLLAANRHTLDSGLLPFGNHLVRVFNPDAPPDLWLYDVQPLPGFVAATPERPLVSWTAALVHAGRFVYLVGSRDVGPDAVTVLGRIPSDDLVDAGWRPEPQFLVQEGDGARWASPPSDPERLYVVPGLPGTSEAAIDFADGLGWYTFQIAALRYEIRLYTAADLLGPWTDRGVVYEIPAPWSTTTRGACPAPPPPDASPGEVPPACEHVYAAYAPKAHPELANEGGHAVSYNVNVWSGGLDAAVRALETLPEFYVPRMLAAPGR
ncbi:MAG: hypothetical protein AB1689_13175 [Thermodesulfobacteriota bacterium]